MSSIEWTDKTWNPLVGCSRVSEGCRHCYAERFVHRKLSPQHRGLTLAGEKGPRWNGEVRLVEARLGDPLRWRKPQRVFVNSLSDLFHESVAFETIAAIFGVMAGARHHTFQLLTKRPQRAREFFAWVRESAEDMVASIGVAPGAAAEVGFCASLVPFGRDALRIALRAPWPLPNVWLGVSVEDQRTADERIPVLLELPAALRFVSYEPALGPIDFDLPRCDECGEAARAWSEDGAPWCSEHERECSYGHWLDFPSDGSFGVPAGEAANGGIAWAIVGGESGPGARPFDVAWARSTIEQCRAAGTKCFVKQLGARPIAARHTIASLGGEVAEPLALRHRKGADPSEWPEDLRVREMPEVRS